jgi:hypothetical protein
LRPSLLADLSGTSCLRALRPTFAFDLHLFLYEAAVQLVASQVTISSRSMDPP